jgi:hypothetical protein
MVSGGSSRCSITGGLRVAAKMAGEQINEAPHFRRKMMPMWIDGQNGDFIRRILSENRDQPTGCDVVGYQKARCNQ